ncbi:HAMP domain-containing histidine kinase [Candidatus Micrarchaeota archaeon]|nr:HAMP domain-containing histidine kinase [Candidatus Micrarchaeota archaeon]
MIGAMGGGFEIRAEGRRVFSTSSYDELSGSAQPLSQRKFSFEIDGKEAICHVISRSTDAKDLVELLDQKLKYEVSRGIMHDLSNLLVPLTANQDLFCSAVSRGDHEEVGKLMQEMTLVTTLISQLCTRSSRLLFGKLELSTENLSEVCDDVIALTRKPILMTGKDIRVTNLVSPMFEVNTVISDLQLAIWNIFLNAANHGIVDVGRIDIRAVRDDKLTYLLIENDGIQIPQEVAETLLKKPVTGGDGRGVGLYSCAKALMAFGGDISFTSNQIRTTFRISLPSAEEENLSSE